MFSSKYKDLFRVLVKGINRDLSSFNDDTRTINIGKKSSKELTDFFKRIMNKEITNFSAYTPKIWILKANKWLISVKIEDKGLIDISSGNEISIQSIERTLKTGEPFIDPSMLKKSESTFLSKTFLMHNIPPTDRKKVNINTIDIGPGSPQISMIVWRSFVWKQCSQVFPVLSAIICFFCVILMFFGVIKGDNEIMLFLLLTGFSCIPIFIVLQIIGRHEFRMGVDWKTNTLWCWRASKGITGFERDANRISGFNAVPTSIKNSEYSTWLYLNSKIVDKIDVSFVLLRYIQDKFMFMPIKGSEIASGKEATAIVEKMNQMWEIQRKN